MRIGGSSLHLKRVQNHVRQTSGRAGVVMMVSVTIACIPSFSNRFEVAPVGIVENENRARYPDTGARRQAARPRWPSPRSILSAGPLIVLPPTIGLIAATRDRARRSASRIPRQARGSVRARRTDSTARGLRPPSCESRRAPRERARLVRCRATRFARPCRERVGARNTPGTESRRARAASRRCARDHRSSAGLARLTPKRRAISAVMRLSGAPARSRSVRYRCVARSRSPRLNQGLP